MSSTVAKADDYASVDLRADAEEKSVRSLRMHRVLSIRCLVLTTAIVALGSCQSERDGDVATQSGQGFPVGSPVVIALGNLSPRTAPTETEIKLSEFFFGTVPETPLGLVKPVALAASGDDLLICDTALNGVFRWDSSANQLQTPRLDPRPQKPVGIDVADDGAMVVADAESKAVWHYAASGQLIARLTLSSDDFRPADAAFVGDEIWATNAAASRVEVFNGKTGQHLRSIGQRGPQRGQFGVPLGLTAINDNAILVVDMLNVRVQMIDRQGSWKGNVGRAGDRVGAFGRPKDVAVGPDGTIFVMDAASQRVHAFNAAGEPLLAFGEPGSGAGALAMPNGICVAPIGAIDKRGLPAGFQADYLVCVAEQLEDPGIRVFAWSGAAVNRIAQSAKQTVSGETRVAAASVTNPHWQPQQCNACHEMTAGAVQPIVATQIDQKCLSCHDGIKASQEPHPIGRLADTDTIDTPDDWFVVNNRLSCITCHDIQRHCDRGATKPLTNTALLRFYDPEKPLAFCTQCHQQSDLWRLSPHDQLADDGRMRTQTCGYCHTNAPTIDSSGRRHHQPKLRKDSSDVCLSCHTKHWDYSPRGHVERETTPEIRRHLAARALLERKGANASLSAVEESLFKENVIPLTDKRVTCFSCHNPHQEGLFPSNTPLGSYASDPNDKEIDLRLNRTDLCQSCHGK